MVREPSPEAAAGRVSSLEVQPGSQQVPRRPRERQTPDGPGARCALPCWLWEPLPLCPFLPWGLQASLGSTARAQGTLGPLGDGTLVPCSCLHCPGSPVCQAPLLTLRSHFPQWRLAPLLQHRLQAPGPHGDHKSQRPRRPPCVPCAGGVTQSSLSLAALAQVGSKDSALASEAEAQAPGQALPDSTGCSSLTGALHRPLNPWSLTPTCPLPPAACLVPGLTGRRV